MTKRCHRCHRDLKGCEENIAGWVKMHKCNGITKKRQRMLVVCLGAGCLERVAPLVWLPANTLFGRNEKLSKRWERTQTVYWGARHGLVTGNPDHVTMRYVSLTDEGTIVATRVLQLIATCPQCEKGSMKLCEDEGAIVGIGCHGCGGMFDARVLARSWMELQD